ncbi:MAG: hypothetical protein ACLU4N_04805 [Butyricimonas faecihominis]
MVTTKQGRPGKMRVNYSMSLTMGLKPQRDANLMNSREKLAWEQSYGTSSPRMLCCQCPSRGGCRYNGNGPGK